MPRSPDLPARREPPVDPAALPTPAPTEAAPLAGNAFPAGSREAKRLRRLMDTAGAGSGFQGPDREDVESIAGQRFVRHWKQLDNDQGGSSRSYAWTTGHHIRLDLTSRKRRRLPETAWPEGFDPPSETSVEDQVLDWVVIEHLLDRLVASGQIRRRAREAFLLRVREQRPAVDIALRLGLGAKSGRRTVAYDVAKVEQLLREALGTDGLNRGSLDQGEKEED